MKYSILHILFFIFLKVTNVFTFSENIHPLLLLRNKRNDECIMAGQSCLDCRTMRFCIPFQGAFIATNVECEAISPTNKYCDRNTNECTTNEEVCDDEQTEAPCFGTGYLPYPLDCRKYLLCVNIQGEIAGKVYNCPTGTVYQHELQGCYPGYSCFDFSNERLCRNKPGQIVTYPPDESIYAWCPSLPDEKLWVFRCTSPYEFNMTVGACKPVCRTAGKIADLEDAIKFYECILIGNGYVAVSRTCPEGTIFNDDEKICSDVALPRPIVIGPFAFPADPPNDSLEANRQDSETNNIIQRHGGGGCGNNGGQGGGHGGGGHGNGGNGGGGHGGGGSGSGEGCGSHESGEDSGEDHGSGEKEDDSTEENSNGDNQ